MKIRHIMTKAPTCCSPETTLDAAARLMLERDCGEIPVCDGTRLVGVITDRDIALRAFAAHKNPLETLVRDVMTTHLITVDPDTELDAVVGLLEKHQLRRLPVVTDGRIVGIVSQADLVPVLPNAKVAELLQAVSRSPVDLAVPAP
jgi:CBS domain-containing protein